MIAIRQYASAAQSVNVLRQAVSGDQPSISEIISKETILSFEYLNTLTW